jgi:hypothetical protein
MQFITKNYRLILLVGFLSILFIYHLIFFRYFPTVQGYIGHDYSYFLPNLLNGTYWFRNNSLFSVPWFTPAFCAGLPFFPNPQNIYYSIPQLLSFFVNPLHAVYLSFLCFAGLGFVGTYLLLRRVFNLSIAAAYFGATLFLFNGFYSSRMLIGHMTYQVFALLPLLSWLLLCKTNVKFHEINYVVFAGIIFSYMFHAGAANFIVPLTLSIICIWTLLGVVQNVEKNRFWMRLGLSGLISLLLSAAKLLPTILYIREIRWDLKLLPGFDGFWNAVGNIFKMLFLSFDKDIASDVLNFPYHLEQHEFDYGLTIVPFVLLSVFFCHIIIKFISSDIHLQLTIKKVVFLVFLIMLLLLPVVLNIYNPTWSLFLKSLPYIENSSHLIRWIAIVIPIVVILAAIALDHISNRLIKNAVVLVCIAIVLSSTYYKDRGYYKDQLYDPSNILSAWHSGSQDITFNEILPGMQKNDLLVLGASEILCYEPMFGYQLESFDPGRLRQGSIMEIDNGYLNFKNPACYIFPEQNQCMAGDHFKVQDNDKLKLFASYKTFKFERSSFQKFLNIINVLTICAVVIFLLLSAIKYYLEVKSAKLLDNT